MTPPLERGLSSPGARHRGITPVYAPLLCLVVSSPRRRGDRKVAYWFPSNFAQDAPDPSRIGFDALHFFLGFGDLERGRMNSSQ